jgi:hypothetical protein
VVTFSNLSYTKSETITIDFANTGLTGVTSSSVTVNPGSANKLTILTQPAPTAIAGAAFAQQPVVRVEDAFGNLRSSDNSTVVTASRSAGSGTLQGTLTATAINGVATFGNLAHNVANTISLGFTASGLTGATSANIVVSPAAFTKLQLLVPGETAAPGSASGKTGTPTARTASTAFNVTVNAVDAFWNVDNSVTDTVSLTSSDANTLLPADTALVSGTQTLSVTFNAVGSETLTATDVTDGTKTTNTSPTITVNAGAFAKLQLLLPGETAAPGTASGKTGTPTAQIAGTAFNVTVNAVDANWNPVSSTHTVGITTSDVNDTHPANAALSAGTRTFAVTLKSAGSWTVTATDITDGTKTANTSPAVTVNAGAFAKLQILAPGETAAPGSATGKTGTPTAEAAGTPFNVTVNAVDANWNPVTSTDMVGITSNDSNAVMPANAALVAGTQTFSITLKTSGARTLTATDITDVTKTSNTTPSITVNAGAFAKMQVLVPGETAAPGTATGKTGTPSAQTAGTAFNVTVRSVDADWNLVSSTHTVGITSSDSNASLPANGALSAGTRTVSVTLNTAGSQTVTAADITDGTKTANTSPAITVNVGPASKLTVQTQPSTTAIAGIPFAQQPVVRVEDAGGNLITADNGRVITAVRGTGTGTLQGTLTATTVNGVATFANISYNVAETITANFTASGLTSATSGNIVVAAAAADRLAFTTQPGGVSRVGTPLATQPVVKSQDAFGNNSTVGLPANLTLTLNLTAGSGTLLGTTNVDLGTAAGNGIATFTNLQCSDAGTNKQFTASASGLADAIGAAFNVGGVAQATGADAISADTTGGTYTTLTGPTYFEVANGDIGTGTIILNPPAGFVFDASGTPAPTVLITRIGGTGSNLNNINDVASGTSAAITSRSTTQITFTVSAASSSGVTCSLTWQNVRIRPSAGTPLASGNLTRSGTATMAGVTSGSTSFGPLTEVAGVANRLAFSTQPGSATAGAIFGAQPVVRTRDQFGNNSTVGLSASKTVTLALTAGTGPLLGTTSIDLGTAAGNGVAAFTDLQLNSAGTNKQLTASASGSTNAVSSVFTVNAAAADHLTIQTQPSTTATAGVAFAQQPVIRIEDSFGNLRSTDNTTVITASRNAGSGTLQGTTSATASGGVVTFANLSHTVADTISIDFAGTGLPVVTSGNVLVSAGAASKLTILTQPSSTATAGVPFAQQPVVRIEDSFGNLRSTDNTTVVTAARSAGSGTLQGTTSVTAVNGLVTCANLAHNLASTITIQFSSGSLSSATSGTVAVSAGVFAKLQLLVPGETAAPGTGTGKTGTPTAQTAATAFNVTVNAVDANWNLVNAADTVNISSTDANAVLPADAALVNGSRSFSVTLKAAGSQTLTASDVTDGTKAASTSSAITVNAGAFAKMQVLLPGETAAPGSATGKTGTPDVQATGTGFTITVRAVDANWNLVSSAPANNIGITTTDPNDTHPANATLSSGTRTFSVTFKTAGSWTVTASNLTDGTKTANTSSAITANAGAFTKLQILVPGETAAPGTTTGKTGTPFTQTAGLAFNVTVNAVDANWNTVSAAADDMGITSSDANATLPPSGTFTAGTSTVSVTLRTAGTSTLTASDLTDGSKTASTSPSITVGAGAFAKLQLLVPGETAAPGTATGKTGTPATQPVGAQFTVTVRSVDADWNLVSSIHTVSITSSDASATLPSNNSLSSGTRTFNVTLRTLGSATVTATDLSDGSKTASTSPSITVNVGAPNRLVIQTQPSSTATAGESFAQQPVIRVEDAYGNLVTTDNSRVITATRSAGTGALQGTVTATTVNGIVTFTDLSHNVATTITINFTASGLTSATSGSIVVSPAIASQLTFLTQPSGTRTGSPLATQPVVRTQDAYGNTSSVGLALNLNLTLNLTSSSGYLLGTTNVDIGTAAGNGTATFTTVECSDAGTNKQMTALVAGFTSAVSAAFDLDGVERATGGTAILSSTAGGAYTTLTGPVYYEYLTGDAGLGTIILNAPSGFIFDIGGTAPTVRVDRLLGGGNDSKNINSVASGTSVAITSRTTTQITFTVSVESSGGVTCSLTWQNVRVRPSAASPLASGNITKTGTSTMAAVTNSSTSFGSLIEYGPPVRLIIQTQPSTTATAGVAFAQQPVIRIEDAVGHLLTTDNTTVVTATRSAGSGTLQGTTSRTAVNGLVTFTNLAHNVATNITISFTSGSLTNATSTAIAVSPAAASQLVYTTQPANGTFGSALVTQPVLRSRDQFGNNSSVGLAASHSVTVTLSAGTGPLLGTTTLDIGTGAGNGIVSYSDLRIDSAGSNKQLTASASGLTNAVSSTFTVAKANQSISFGALAGKTYGDAPFVVSATASSGLPVSFSIVSGPATISAGTVTLTGNGTVTVRASQSGDADWNAAASVDRSFTVAKKTVTGSITANSKTYDGTTAATIATRTLSGVIGSDDVTLTGGTATFANKNVGNGKTVTATGLSLTGAIAGNYQLASTSATTTANITAKELTITGVTAVNKVYDDTTAATLDVTNAAMVGVVSGDAVTLNTGSATGAFADANVGVAKTVTVSGLTFSGADAGNYTLTQPTTTASITAYGLTVTGITAANKVYDGTTTATLNVASAVLVGVASGDTVTLNTGSTAAAFANANVGTAKSVTVSGLTISGADAANYALTQPSTTADITAVTLTGSITADNKTYDGTTAATIATRTLSGVLGSEDVSMIGGTATFADKNIGTGKSVTATGLSLSGADAGNYQLTSTSTATTADITARTLTVSATGVNKIYDGATAVTVTLSDNRVSGDDLSASSTTASFADKNIGSGKTVSVSGISVTGTDAGNYQLASTSAATTADITPAILTVSATGVNKVYDGTTAATVTLSDDRIAGDDLTASYTTAVFADKYVQNGKLVSVSGISVSGTDAGNYTVNTEASTVADITGATLTVVGIVAENKVYDGTTVATLNLTGAVLVGVVSGDDVIVDATAVAGAFSDAEVGTNKLVTVSGLTLIGADAAQYTLTQPTATADITPAP